MTECCSDILLAFSDKVVGDDLLSVSEPAQSIVETRVGSVWGWPVRNPKAALIPAQMGSRASLLHLAEMPEHPLRTRLQAREKAERADRLEHGHAATR